MAYAGRVPELPEVETIRAELEPVLTGHRFERVDIYDARLVAPADPRAVAAELEGEGVDTVGRRGKYLVIGFESGASLVVHLRMTGSFVFAHDDAADRHTRAAIVLNTGGRLRYRDVRRFGTWYVLDRDALGAYFAVRLGVEPLGPSFTAAWLGERLAGRRAPVKAAVLDQRTVAGLGNIYADEALWRAGLHPLQPAGDLDAETIRRLRRAIQASLRAGVARLGATLSDYRRPNGQSGTMQEEFAVYGRAGEPCRRCGALVAKTRAGGRGTWYCPVCQPAFV